jgi:hypothetical protein
MSINTKKLLLVEGESDRGFFEAVCKLLQLPTEIQVAVPREMEGRCNTKEGVFDRLSILMKRLATGNLTHLGVIVDADHKNEGGLGCRGTIDRMVSIVAPDFYLQQDADQQVGGLFFQHSDDLAPIGLWVMPNNRDEGMLEDWIKGCISTEEQDLLNHAVTVIDALPQPKFNKTIHRAKAEVATWLAWQKTPGHGAYRALKEKSIDPECAQFKQLAHWLNQVYQPLPT